MTIRIAFRMVTPRTWTGGTNYLLNICRVLRLYEPKFIPVFFAPPDLDNRTVDMIVAATGTRPRPLRERTHRDDILAIAGIPERESTQAFEAANIDLVFESTGYYGPQLPYPIVSWLPDFQHRQLSRFFSPKAWLTREARYRLILSNRKHILLSSEDARSDMIRFYGPSKAAVHVAPFAVCMDHLPSFEEGEIVRLEHRLPERFIFLPNQFWPHKNHAIVVEALGILGHQAPTIAASGSGDTSSEILRQQLEARATALGVKDNFRKLGHLSYKDVLALNVRADAVINPSLFEGWSTTVEEAKALGTPMILSDLPVHREQVTGSATFFDPQSATDCARSILAAMARPARSPGSLDAAYDRNLAAQRKFAERLRAAFLAAMNDHGTH